MQTTDGATLVTQAAYEPGLGVLAAQTDAAGLLTTFQYDTFGRIRADHPPAGGGRSSPINAARHDARRSTIIAPVSTARRRRSIRCAARSRR